MTPEEILEKHFHERIFNHLYNGDYRPGDKFYAKALAAMTEYASQEAAAMKEKYRERAIRMFTYGRNGHSIESALQAWDKEEI